MAVSKTGVARETIGAPQSEVEKLDVKSTVRTGGIDSGTSLGSPSFRSRFADLFLQITPILA